jgi:hypothetical protein
MAGRDRRRPGRTNGRHLHVVREDRPRPHIPRPRPPSDSGLRHSIIYRMPVWEIDSESGLIRLFNETGRCIGQTASLDLPHTGRPRLVLDDYVGQSVRTCQARLAEHLEDYRGDLIARHPDGTPLNLIVLEQGLWTDAHRDAREAYWIKRLRPRFNHEYNLDNPRRIEIWRQKQMRHARDRAAGRELWLPAEQRTRAAQEQVRLSLVQAGLDGREPRYPLQIVWSWIAMAGRSVSGLPNPVRANLVMAIIVLHLALAGAALMARQGASGTVALVGTLVLAVLLVLVMPWRRRRRRRR